MTDNPVGGVEIYNWNEEGYRPQLQSADWQVATLNWEPGADLSNLSKIERHQATDEVFILTKGKAALVTIVDGQAFVFNAICGQVMNVLSGIWHTVIGEKGSSWIIIEKKDTHLNDVDKRDLTPLELERIRNQVNK